MGTFKTMKGLHLVSTAFPVKQIDTEILLWPVNLNGTSFDQATSTVV